MNIPGRSILELGTCRMGDNPKTSALNKWNQSHDVKNLFVVDGSSFVTGGAQNPTLTILALSMRASEYLAEQARKGEL
jgi:choline dehydrogenase-like flavoprotein